MAEAACVVCGKKHMTLRSKVAAGKNTVCSKTCQGKNAQSFQDYSGRQPIHGGCVNNELSPIYRRWAAMKGRCNSNQPTMKKHYKDKGITVCKEWLRSFPAFESWAKANGFREDLELDRRDNLKGYSPSNCRWVTRIVNANNRSTTMRLTNGELATEVARRLGVSGTTIRNRLKKNPDYKA